MPRVPALAPGERVSAYPLVPRTLADLGDQLPHGILRADGPPVRSFTFRAPTMGTRKALGALATRKDLAKYPGKHAATWLAVALRELGGAGFDEGKADENALTVGRLTVGDVLYLIFRWQALSHPSGLALTGLGCPTCGASFERVTVDLGSIEVAALPDDATTANPPVARVGLRHPIDWRDARITTLLVRPPTWTDHLWGLTLDQWRNGELFRWAHLRAAVIGCDALDLDRLPDAVIDDLWPEDVDLIDEALADLTPTPDLEVSVPCPSCGRATSTVLDWQDQGFSSGSSKG